ncbi:MAG: hypothetical protein WKF45_01195 [Ilumatobacteraceae bacterium]
MERAAVSSERDLGGVLGGDDDAVSELLVLVGVELETGERLASSQDRAGGAVAVVDRRAEPDAEREAALTPLDQVRRVLDLLAQTRRRAIALPLG